MQINFLENRCLLAADDFSYAADLFSDITFQNTLAETVIEGPSFFESVCDNPATKLTETFIPALIGQGLKHGLDIHAGNGIAEAIYSNIIGQVTTKSIITRATVPLDTCLTDSAQWNNFDEYFEDYKFQSMTEAAIKLSMTTFGNSIIHYAVRPVVGSLIKSGVGATSETLGYVANSFLPGSGEIIKPVFSGAMNFLIPWTAAKITTVIAQNGLLCGADYVSDYLKAS